MRCGRKKNKCADSADAVVAECMPLLCPVSWFKCNLKAVCLNGGLIHHKKLIFVRYCWDFYISPLGCLKGVSILAFPWLWFAERWDGTQDIRHIWGHHLGLVLPPCKHQFISRLIQVWGVREDSLSTPPPPTPSPHHSQYSLWCILGHSVVRVNKLNYTIVSVEAEQLNTQTSSPHSPVCWTVHFPTTASHNEEEPRLGQLGSAILLA